MPDTVQLVDPEGRSHDIPLSDVAGLLNQNWHQRTTADTSRLAGEAAQEADYGGAGGAAKAIGYAAARGLTLGLSDVAARAAGKPAESLRGLEEAHPTASGVSEFVGALAPSLIAPESLAGRAAARTPAALVSGIGKTILHSAEQEGAGLAGRAVAGTVGAAAEGALYGGGAYLSQVALEDKPLAAEGFAAAMGKGALWAAPIGGALTLGERALVRAKSLFPRSEVTREAARAVNNEASSAIATSLRDGDIMLEAARRRIAAADAAVAKAESAGTIQRAVFGDAHPQTAVDQLAAGHEKQQLVEAVQEYTQSKTALEDWARLEADPDLEAALVRIRAPDVQVGAPRLRTPEFGEVVPGQTTSPELGEFGLERTSVGKGLAKGTPVSEMPPLPMREPPAGLPELPIAASPDITRAGRKLATRTPVGEPPIGLPEVPAGPAQEPIRFTPTPRPAGGSQGGKWYQDEHGQQWFGKSYSGNTDRIEGENLANRIYRAFGIDAPETRVVSVDGKPMLMSREVPGTIATSAEDIGATNAKDGFVIDAWLANHDVVGTGYDNILISGPKATRIDNGGATIWRAKGESKDLKALVDELQSMRDPQRYAGKAFAGLTDEELQAQLRHFAEEYPRRKAEIDGIIDASGLSRTSKIKIKTGLNDRAAWLIEQSKPSPRALSDEEFNALAQERQALLSDAERERAIAYTKQGLYAQLNAPLREAAGRPGGGGLKPLPEHLHKIVADLDSAIAKSPAPRDMLVVRGVNGRRSTAAMGALKPGDVYVDPGFVSTSYVEQIGKDYTEGYGVRKGVELRITVPEGYPALPVPSEFPKEREMLLGRGGRFVVTARDTAEDGHIVLHMRVRPPDTFEAQQLPEGFVATAKDSRGRPQFSEDPDISQGIPKYKDIPTVKDGYDVAYIVRPSELAEVGVVGKPAKPEPWTKSDQVPAVEINIHRGPSAQVNGEWEYGTAGYSIDAGGERLLAAAADGDRPVLVRFLPTGVSMNGKGEPLAEDIRKAIGSRVSTPESAVAVPSLPRPTDTLTGQLRGTQAQLEGGVGLKDIGAPARAEYAAAKAERTTAAAEKYRAEAVAKRAAEGSGPKATQRIDLKDMGLDFDPAKRSYFGTAEALTPPPVSEMDVGLAPRVAAADVTAVREPRRIHVNTFDVAGRKLKLEARTEPSLVPNGKPRTTVTVSRMSGDEELPVGTAEFRHRESGLYPESVNVDPPWQRKGIGTKMYETAELVSGKRIIPSDTQTPQGAAFSAKFRSRRVVDDDAIAKALRKRNGKDVNIGADLSRAAKVINDHEAAAAKLTDALGTDAPATAVAQAKAYRQALAQHSETAANSTAKAASDLNTKVGPAAAGGQTTVVDDAVVKALRKHDAATARSADRAVAALEREAVAASPPAAAAKDAAPAAPKKRTAIGTALGVAADVGTAIEVLNAMGVHTPDLSKIPVIGPVLSMYLKARAVMGILGRRGGSIGRSAESVIASKSAAVRDRINAAAQAALDIGATAARKAAPIAGPAGALAYRLFPGDGDIKSKNPAILYQARMNELARAAEPGAIDRAVGDRVHTSDPDLHDAIVAQTERAVQFLSSKAPRAGLLQSAVPSDGKWHPSRAALEEFAKYVAAVHDPAGVLEDLARGHPSREGAETLRSVYPALFAQAQRTLLARASEIQHTLPYARRVSISLMYRVPVDLTMSPEHLRYLQPPEPPPGPAGAPGGVGPAGPSPAPPAPPALADPLQLGQQTLTSLERRAGV